MIRVWSYEIIPQVIVLIYSNLYYWINNIGEVRTLSEELWMSPGVVRFQLSEKFTIALYMILKDGLH